MTAPSTRKQWKPLSSDSLVTSMPFALSGDRGALPDQHANFSYSYGAPRLYASTKATPVLPPTPLTIAV